MARLDGIHRALCRGYSGYLIKLEAQLQKDYEQLLTHESLFWKQKSRVDWLKGGDRNTKFFHLTTLVRHRRNRIESLKNSEGNYVIEKEELQSLVIDYFNSLFQDDHHLTQSYQVDNLFPDIMGWEMDAIGNPTTKDEVKHAVFVIGDLKTPGPDGFPAIFFQKCWNTCKVL